ncbi:MAG: glycosyltransferase [Patescibacteria group bacterium]
MKKIFNFKNARRINLWVIFYLVVYIILVIKLVTIQQIGNGILFATYSIAVSFYILSRFSLAYFYKPSVPESDLTYEPTISFAVPSKNEGENIRETILKIANTNYPKNKFDIIAINDGSDDNTLDEMLRAKKIVENKNYIDGNVSVKVIDWKINRGKREGMAESVRQSDKDIVIFIDSDSFIDPEAARELVKYFIYDEVAAVAGHAYVANAQTNFLTKMQAVRYFVAFKAYKAAEALFGAVTCCSGCCSAYRRSYMNEVMNEWLNQKFLGVQCTYGDDRSLTNYLLRKGYKTLFSNEAIAYTFVPDTLNKFIKQQFRWKKSWVRESLIAGTFMWKRNPIMSISFYLGIILPLLAPIIVIRALVWYPYTTGNAPFYYLFGLLLMAIVYGLYYYIYTLDKKWVYGVVFAAFYTIILIWQLPWAILNLRDARWGTR